MTLKPRFEVDELGESASDFEGDSGEDVKGKGKEEGKGKTVRRRSSKACDNCRKSKCKCTRIPDPETGDVSGPCQNCITTNSECTYLGASRKRGPPKGYIEAIESRLHRMEALLGGLLQNDDPRAQTLLGELMGDDEAREILTQDLRAAKANGEKSKPRKSWRRSDEEEPPPPRHTASTTGGSTGVSFSPFSTRGPSAVPPEIEFNTTATAAPTITTNTNNNTTTTTSSDGDRENLARYSTDLNFANQSLTDSNVNGTSFGGVVKADIDRKFDYLHKSYRVSTGTTGDSDEDANDSVIGRASSSELNNGGLSQSPNGYSYMGDLSSTNSGSNVGGIRSGVNAFPGGTNGNNNNNPNYSNSASRQRRRLNAQGSLSGATTGGDQSIKTIPIPFSSQTKQNLPHHAIAHTGTSFYSLSNEAELNPAGGDGEEGDDIASARGHGMSELADVVGQLSLNENAEVRYHGRSSGLYLISKSARYKDFFWQFPSAGVWPPADNKVVKTEKEVLGVAEDSDPLPDRETQRLLLDLYWTYVHPHFPILYKVSFMRQYRHTLSNPNSREKSTPAGTGKVPMVLLLSIFALAARYSDLDPPSDDGKCWTAGQQYQDMAKKIVDYDYGSSKLVTVQALLLLAYREIGTGAMSQSWIFTGMAIRMAQDLGLFRDVDKWFLPVQRFSHEEKQTRKRVWWGCILLDRYTASYIGRPGTIHERDYDTSFPSEDEPDEHEQWQPIRPDGSEWSMPPRHASSENRIIPTARYPACKAHTLSCFTASAALAVIINRIIANIYAIRIRVLGQSSGTLLSLLDQSLASWYLALPSHLAYNPVSKKVPPPHVLALHLKFYSALILLHRPFIPGQNSESSPCAFPSHSICTTSANAIANIITIFAKTFTLRQCPPFLTYPVFSAAVICVYNAGFDAALAQPAKVHLLQCMNALKEMQVIWGSALRAVELLAGLVDLRDAELSSELQEIDALRGTKRTADAEDKPVSNAPLDATVFGEIRPANFHIRPLPRPTIYSSSKTHGTISTGVSFKGPNEFEDPLAQSQPVVQPRPQHPQQNLGPSSLSSDVNASNSLPFIPRQHQPPVLPMRQTNLVDQNLFRHVPPDTLTPSSSQGMELPHQSYDILTARGPALDLSQFRSPPGTAGGVTNFGDLLNSFLAPGEPSSDIGANFHHGKTTDFQQSAFFGMPTSVDPMTEDWAAYLPQAFFSPEQGQGPREGHYEDGSPESFTSGRQPPAG